MTTLREFREQLSRFKNDPDVSGLSAFLADALTRSDLDGEAREEADRLFSAIERDLQLSAERALPTMPDGPARRRAVRFLAYRNGEHFSIHDAVCVLARPSSQTAEVLESARSVFMGAMHVAVDFMFDARQGETKGTTNFVLFGLLNGLVDELLAAFHLSQRAFASQCYAHVRTVEEVLDVVELLRADPAWLAKWVGFSDAKAEKALFFEMSKEIKKTAPRDELYAFMSAVGTHAQFRNLQSRSAINGKDAIFFFVGSPKQFEASAILTARAALALAYKVASVFADKLHPDEVRDRLDAIRTLFLALTDKYLPQLVQQTSIAEEELKRLLSSRLR
jgi:hypothetical protein